MSREVIQRAISFPHAVGARFVPAHPKAGPGIARKVAGEKAGRMSL
jgi:hypothetical protein